MAYDVLGVLKRLQAFEPGLVGVFSENFSAATSAYRIRIRQSIRKRLAPQAEELMDLEKLPDLPTWSISISHGEKLGGWIAVPKPYGVGLDIERRERITAKLAERIAQDGELEQIPDPSLLWGAKESYFKALGDLQPTAITQLRIENWIADSTGGWRFSGARMHGTSFTAVDLVVSAALVQDVSNREKYP